MKININKICIGPWAHNKVFGLLPMARASSPRGDVYGLMTFGFVGDEDAYAPPPPCVGIARKVVGAAIGTPGGVCACGG